MNNFGRFSPASKIKLIIKVTKPSVALPSPVGEGGPLAVDEVAPFRLSVVPERGSK